MEVSKSFSLGEEVSIASMNKNPSNSLISIGDEIGFLTLLNSQNDQNKILVEEEVCLVDHCWINDTQIIYTRGKDIKLFDIPKEKIVTGYIGHQKVKLYHPFLFRICPLDRKIPHLKIEYC